MMKITHQGRFVSRIMTAKNALHRVACAATDRSMLPLMSSMPRPLSMNSGRTML